MADEPVAVPETPKAATHVRLHEATILVTVPMVDGTGAFVRMADVEVAMADPALPPSRRDQMEGLIRGLLRFKGVLS